MEHGVMVVVVSRLLDVIGSNLARRDVAVVDMGATIGTFVVDVVVVEKRLKVDLRSLVEHFVAVETILVGRYGASQHELEDVSEEAHLLTNRLNGVVQSGISLVVEVEFAIDITSPSHILIGSLLRRERYLSAQTQSLSSLLLLFSLLAKACSGLRRHHIGAEQSNEQYRE